MIVEVPSATRGIRGADLRRAMSLANLNTALWAVGNGLVSTLLVIYLVADLGAAGLAVSLILAAPRFAGLMRLGVPALMARVVARKRLCIVSYAASSGFLCLIPLAAVLEKRIANGVLISILVAAWCLYHVAEYCGTVTLWSWLGDLTPRRIRGRLLGRRERWLSGGRVGGLVASAGLASLWFWLLPKAPRWEPLALSAAAGAAMMLAAVIPLAIMPGLPRSPSAVPRTPWAALGRAFVDRAYRRLLVFHFWFSIASGISAAAQEVYPIRVLGFSYTLRQVLQGVMRAGQFSIAPWMGGLVDRWGNRPVMILSQCIVATGPLFFLIATPERPWFAAGAFLVWIAYAGLNVGLDNIKLKLAPAENNSPFVAVYHTVGDLANGLTTIAGGAILDWLNARGSAAGPLYVELFVAGFVCRVLAVPLLAWLIEPGARRIWELRRGNAVKRTT
jgi:MFS family permease